SDPRLSTDHSPPWLPPVPPDVHPAAAARLHRGAVSPTDPRGSPLERRLAPGLPSAVHGLVRWTLDDRSEYPPTTRRLRGIHLRAGSFPAAPGVSLAGSRIHRAAADVPRNPAAYDSRRTPGHRENRKGPEHGDW